MPLPLTFEALTDVGLERSENQDFYGTATRGEVEFYIVCDGMGGHAGGYVASRLAVKTICDTIENPNIQGKTPDVLRSALQHANAAVHARAKQERRLKGMGTTAVALAVAPNEGVAHVAHVGDSRIYRLRGSTLTRLTRDHTMVQRLVDDGILTEEAAENHPNSNVISRSIGGRPQVEVELGETLQLQAGDLFMLCSDGLSGLVSEPEIATILGSMRPADATRRLVERACESGGHDNITVEVILVGEQGPAFAEYAIQRPGPRQQTITPSAIAEVTIERGAVVDAPPEVRPKKGGALGWLVVLTLGIAALAWLVLTIVQNSQDEPAQESEASEEVPSSEESEAARPPAESAGAVQVAQPVEVVEQASATERMRVAPVAAPQQLALPPVGSAQGLGQVGAPAPTPVEQVAPSAAPPMPTDAAPAPAPSEPPVQASAPSVQTAPTDPVPTVDGSGMPSVAGPNVRAQQAPPTDAQPSNPPPPTEGAVGASPAAGAEHTNAPLNMPALQNATGATDGAEAATQSPSATP